MAEFDRLLRLHPVYLWHLGEIRETNLLPSESAVAVRFLPLASLIRDGGFVSALDGLDGPLGAAARQADPAHHAVLRGLVLTLLGRDEAAMTAVVRALADHPDHPGLLVLGGRLLIRRYRFTEAAALLRRAIGVDPRCGAAFAVLGVMHGLVNDWVEALGHATIAQALGAECGHGLVRLTVLFSRLGLGFPAGSDIDLSALEGTGDMDGRLGRLPPLDGCPRADDPARPIVFVGCDERYLIDHVPTLAYSLESHGAPVTLHLHLFAPGAAAAGVVAGLRRILSVVTVTVTSEAAGGFPSAPRHVFYSCARFIRAWQVSRANRAPLLVVDADALFNRPLSAFPGFDGTAGDVTVASDPDLSPAWETVIAGSVLIQPTAAGRAFLGRVAGVLADTLDGPGAVWFLDQIALTLATQRGRGAARILAAPFRLTCDIRHGDSAVVWAVVVNKTTESAFLARRRQLLCRFGVRGDRTTG